MIRKIFIFTVYCLLSTVYLSYAEEITIIYTGETHAMLYPCNCPNEPDGGVARRATLIKQLRQENPHTLVLDSGGFFAGGLTDEYTQNTELDSQRSLVNLKAMELMGYGAAAVGDDEFNFGRDFLLNNISKTNLAFLSCNIKTDNILPYIIKEIAGMRIGIIGVTNALVNQKAAGLDFIEPRIAIQQAVTELRKNNMDIIILLSHLGEDEDLKLINEIKEIDIVIIGHSRSKEEPYTKTGSTLLLRPSWQGRKLGKLILTVTDKKIIDYKVEELRLSDQITDDPAIVSILPRCFSDNNCKKERVVGTCQEPGTSRAQCIFSEAAKIPLLIITSKLCSVCGTEQIEKYLKTQFPGLSVSYLYYPDKKAVKLIRDFAIKTLPVYLLPKEAEKEKSFYNLKENLEPKGDFYILKTQFSGVSYFLDRQNLKNRLDLFISLYDKDIASLLETIRDFNPQIHFLAVEKDGYFDAPKGPPETEEYLRSVCVEKYYPQNFWNYIICRVKSINSSWWDSCLSETDINKIKICAQGEEGKGLLRENTRLNKELQVMFGPTYLLDNQEIFGLKGTPKKRDLEEIINKKK